MNSYKIIKAIMIIYAFIKSLPLGIMVLMYLIIMEDKTRNLENQIRAGIEEETAPSKKFKEPVSTVDQFIIYKDCVIEKHGDKYYVIKPSGEYLKKIFDEVEDVTDEIDTVAPFFQPKKINRYSVQNIRFVK